MRDANSGVAADCWRAGVREMLGGNGVLAAEDQKNDHGNANRGKVRHFGDLIGGRRESWMDTDQIRYAGRDEFAFIRL